MYNGKTISVGAILWRVLRQPIAADLTYDQAAEFALEFIRLVGAPLSFMDKVTEPLQVEQYKTLLPNDLISIRGVKYVGDQNDNNLTEGIALTYATDLYHTVPENNITEYGTDMDMTYIVQDCVLITSFKEGYVQISYKSIATDEHGYPMVPDNESFKMGLEYYILHRFLEPLWTMGKIQDKVFSYYEQKRHWYLGQAGTSMALEGIDQLEAAMNGINRILINTSAHENFYRNFGTKERFKNY